MLESLPLKSFVVNVIYINITALFAFVPDGFVQDGLGTARKVGPVHNTCQGFLD